MRSRSLAVIWRSRTQVRQSCFGYRLRRTFYQRRYSCSSRDQALGLRTRFHTRKDNKHATTPKKTKHAQKAEQPHHKWTEINRLLVPFGKHVCTGNLPHCST